MSVVDYVTSSAVSMTVAGNTGISPFLSLFLMGVIEKSDPTLLNMEGRIEKILSSWASIAVLGVFTGLEFIGKCIPVLDEMIDSVEIFIVPIMSIFGSIGSLGLLDLAQEAAEVDGEDSGGDTGNDTGDDTGGGDGRQRRRLDGGIGQTMLTVLKTILVLVGIGLSLAIHICKMIIRLIGLTCCAGCCQPLITVVEVCTVTGGIVFAIYVREIAIVTCGILLFAAGWAIHRRFIKKADDAAASANNSNAPAGNTTTTTTTTTIPAPASSQGVAIKDEEAQDEISKIDGDNVAMVSPSSTPDQKDGDAVEVTVEAKPY